MEPDDLKIVVIYLTISPEESTSSPLPYQPFLLNAKLGMDPLYVIAVVSIVVAAVLFVLTKGRCISNFDPSILSQGMTPLNPTPYAGDVCSSHCFSDSHGEVMDQYDCCNCMATIAGNYEPDFYRCMCHNGYEDYCYRPVTNLLLSQ